MRFKRSSVQMEGAIQEIECAEGGCDSKDRVIRERVRFKRASEQREGAIQESD